MHSHQDPTSIFTKWTIYQCIHKQMDNLCINATFIHFVFDSYLDGSVKDSERMRSKILAVELTNIDQEKLLLKGNLPMLSICESLRKLWISFSPHHGLYIEADVLTIAPATYKVLPCLQQLLDQLLDR